MQELRPFARHAAIETRRHHADKGARHFQIFMLFHEILQAALWINQVNVALLYFKYVYIDFIVEKSSFSTLFW